LGDRFFGTDDKSFSTVAACLLELLDIVRFIITGNGEGISKAPEQKSCTEKISLVLVVL